VKKVVFGKIVYDSENASLVYQPSGELSLLTEAQIQNLFDPEDLFWLSDEALYITPEGRFFIFGGGGMSGEVLQPLSTIKAGEWVKSEVNKLLKMVKPESAHTDLLESVVKNVVKELGERYPEMQLS